MSFIKLKYGNIKGDSSESTHEGWINISTFSFGSSRSISQNHNSMRQVGVPNISEIKISKPICSATCQLMQETWSGSGQEIEFNFLQETPNGLNVIGVYKLSEARISSHSFQANSLGEIGESYSISFTKIDIAYAKFDVTGKPVSNMCVGFNLQEMRYM